MPNDNSLDMSTLPDPEELELTVFATGASTLYAATKGFLTSNIRSVTLFIPKTTKTVSITAATILFISKPFINLVITL